MPLFYKYLRRRSLADKKFGKYLLYAIGEILILVIGVFFALQANIWNETRQNEVTEISILKAIKAGLEQDLATFQDYDIALLEEVLVSSQIIIDHLEDDLPYNDSLAYHFLASNYTTHLIYNKGAISTLKSTGVNIITNEKVRNQIIELYDVNFDFMDYLGRNHDSYCWHIKKFVHNIRFEQGSYFDDPATEKAWDGEMIPLDFEALKNDREYNYQLKTYMNETNHYLQECYRTKSQISQVILSIEEEVKKLEK